jgi:BRCA1/BRCA2-containing complex subunit 3
MAHALTTESEEIMGLLLGDVVDAGGHGCCEERLKARIWSVSLHRREQAVRSDDRVEISPEQLAAASDEAERMTAELGIHTRVVGWFCTLPQLSLSRSHACSADLLAGVFARRYHSHPHLAVVPSHVDVRTQAQYQQMDSTFIGLIFSVFNSGRVVPGVATGTQEETEAGGAMMVSMHGTHSEKYSIVTFFSECTRAL